MTWDTLFTDITPYPTIVVPVNKASGRMTHAFCVVDDLIFDASTPFALKLNMKSVNWIFDGEEVEIYKAFRYEQKVSPPGQKVEGKYERPVTYHWNLEAEERARQARVLKDFERVTQNKAYDIENAPPPEAGNDPLIKHFKKIQISI
jgi:hypothetical protein